MLIELQTDFDKEGFVVGADGERLAASTYKPDDDAIQVTNMVMRDWVFSNVMRNKPFREFNDMSLLERQSLDQMRFNTYQEPASDDPDESWKSQALRPITRNRAISIAAHLTASIIYPLIFAQNENDDEDKDAAIVMRDLMEWANDQANYEQTFVFAIIAALVNPAVIIHTEFSEVYRTIKEKLDKGEYDNETAETVDSVEQEEGEEQRESRKPKYKLKKILDDLFSGFQDAVVPLDEIWFPDFYQRDIQKQPNLIRRKAITKDIAEAKYGGCPNFVYVKPGIQIMYVEATNQFYQQYDQSLRSELIEEVVYWNRAHDLQLHFLNGVLMDDPDECNPRQDKKYPFVMGGYELIDEGQFAFYKSLVNKMGTDEDVIQTLYRMIIDGTFLQLMPPAIVFGSDTITSSIVTPGTITTLDQNSKLQPIQLGQNLQAGLEVLQKVEGSASESSIDPVFAGQSSDTSGNSKQPSTAFEISRLEQNAKTMLGLFGKMIGFLVKDFSALRISDILQHLTVADVMEITSGSESLKFRNFLLPNKTVDGKIKTRKISFDSEMPTEMTQNEKLDASFDLLQEEGGMDSTIEIYKVNPELFRKMKFKIKVTPDIITPPSDNVRKALNLEEYDRAINNPLVDQESITRELLLGSYSATKSDPDKFMKNPNTNDLGALLGKAAGQNGNQPNSQTGDMNQINNQRRQETQSEVVKSGV